MLDTPGDRAYLLDMPTPTKTARITVQRAAVISCIERRAAEGLPTCAADVTRIVWGGRGHATTYAVVARMVRCGLLKASRSGSRHLLSLTA